MSISNSEVQQNVKKAAMTLLIEKRVAQKLRSAVRETETRYTISEIANAAMERAARLLERWYNHGQMFPSRKTKLKGGRPPKLDNKATAHIEVERMTVYVDVSIADRFRSAVYYTPTHETISRVISRALNHAARILERKRMAAARKRKTPASSKETT